MAWVESHQDLGQHPKTLALVTALNVDLPTAVGLLHLLWHFALKFSWRTANLKKYPPEAISAALGWRGKPDELIKGLQKTGWLDGMRIHDWMDYAGKIVHDRLYNEKRRNTATSYDKKRKSTATVPDLTVPNLTNKKTIVPDEGESQEVLAHFNSVCHKALKLTPERRDLVRRRLAEGRTVAEMKKAITNFSKDDWSDRHKYMDLVYAIGSRSKIDNLDRWLEVAPPKLVPSVGIRLGPGEDPWAPKGEEAIA